jgi:hypothetical protein
MKWFGRAPIRLNALSMRAWITITGSWITFSCWRPPVSTSPSGCRASANFHLVRKPGSFNLDRVMEEITTGEQNLNN